jgi:predicted RNase H-like HicB family nuclease
MLMDGELVIVVEEDNGSYSGKSVYFPGAITQGDTLADLRKNMKEAISLVRESYLEDAKQIVKDQPKGRIITIKP